MPTISMFFGIVVRMFYQEHNPPHIHVEYGDYRASYDIINGDVINGELPIAKDRLVRAWIEIHKDELLANWKLAEQQETLFKINPLQ